MSATPETEDPDGSSDCASNVAANSIIERQFDADGGTTSAERSLLAINGFPNGLFTAFGSHETRRGTDVGHLDSIGHLPTIFPSPGQ